MIEPNIQGFKDAQNQLIEKLGQDITFRVPVPAVYPANVSLDPESGEPYDPTAVPTSGGDHDEVEVKVTVVFRPLGTDKDDVVSETIGLLNTTDVALIARAADYSDIQDAAEFDLNGRAYRITDIVPDGLVGIDRYIVYGQAK